MSKVVVIKCESYDVDMVGKAIKKGVELLGGIESLIPRGKSILLKPNLLSGSAPEKNTTTHPAVFEAVIKMLKSNYSLSYGDSPGFGKPADVAKKAHLFQVAEKYNIPIADFEKSRIEQINNKKYNIAEAFYTNDAVINLPKMKAHQLTAITGAVKNQFGMVTGINKAKQHVRFPNLSNFSEMLVDLADFIRPALHIMDGVVAMEGNGPASGDPVNMNVILISTDPVALDSVFCQLVHVDPKIIYTNSIGVDKGLGTIDDIEIVGEDITGLINKSFKVRRMKSSGLAEIKAVKQIARLFYPRPVIDKSLCVKCGICVEACPLVRKAVFFKNNDKKNVPVYDYNKCIRCYCCQEMCPHKAISVKYPLIGKILGL